MENVCFFFFFFLILFIYLFMAVLGLRFCTRALPSCGKQGPLFIAVCGPLTVAASLVAGTGSRCAGSVVVAHGPSCSAACGILPDQGSNPCPLHCQAGSQPLRHQGSPRYHLWWLVLTHLNLLQQAKKDALLVLSLLPGFFSPCMDAWPSSS